MSDVTRLKFLLNTMESSILKRYLTDVCTRKEFLHAEYKLPYSNGGEGSLLSHVIDVGIIAKSLWDIRQDTLNYDYLIVGALLHEYDRVEGFDILADFRKYLENAGICNNSVEMLTNMLTAPLCEVNNVLNTVIVEALVIKEAKSAANVLLLCEASNDVKDGQKYYVKHPTLPILMKPIKVS